MSKARRAFWLTAVCSLGLIFGAGTAQAETLKDAIALAYEANPTLQQARATQRANDEQSVLARTGYRPTVTAQGTINYSDGYGYSSNPKDPDGTQKNGILSLQLNQTLFASGKLDASVSQADASVESGLQTLRAQEAQILFNVVDAYASVIRDQEALRIRTENVLVLQKQLDETRARFQVGELTKTDVAQSEARLSSANALLSLARGTLEASRATYTALVGRAPGTLEPISGFKNLPVDFNQALSVAEGENGSFLAARFSEIAAKAGVRVAKSGYGPTASWTATYQATAPIDHFNNLDRRDGVTTGVTVSVPLYAGGLIASKVRSANEQLTAATLGVEASRRTITQQLTAAWAQAASTEASYKANEEQVRAARIAFEGTRQEAQVGLRTTIEVLNAEQELRNAELALETARHDKVVAQAQVLQAVGRLEARQLFDGIATYDAAGHAKSVKNKGGFGVDDVVRKLDGLANPSSSETVATRR